MPSYFESLSMVALEAWALGKPVLANGRCDVLKGQCIRSNGGLYYDNFPEFLETLRAIDFNPSLAAALGRNGRDYFSQHYAWPVIERKYLEMFERLQARTAVSARSSRCRDGLRGGANAAAGRRGRREAADRCACRMAEYASTLRSRPRIAPNDRRPLPAHAALMAAQQPGAEQPRPAPSHGPPASAAMRSRASDRRPHDADPQRRRATRSAVRRGDPGNGEHGHRRPSGAGDAWLRRRDRARSARHSARAARCRLRVGDLRRNRRPRASRT